MVLRSASGHILLQPGESEREVGPVERQREVVRTLTITATETLPDTSDLTELESNKHKDCKLDEAKLNHCKQIKTSQDQVVTIKEPKNIPQAQVRTIKETKELQAQVEKIEEARFVPQDQTKLIKEANVPQGQVGTIKDIIVPKNQALRIKDTKTQSGVTC